MSKSINGIFMAGAALVGLSACSDQQKIDPVVAQCQPANTNLEVTDAKQSFMIVNSQTQEKMIVTGRPNPDSHTATYASVPVYKANEDNEGMGWKLTGNNMDVKIQDNKILSCSILDSQGAGLVYSGPK